MYPDLEKLFSDLNKIIPLKAKGFQLHGDENSIFQLEKNRECYFLMPCPLFDNPDRTVPQLLDGLFMYAILASFPQQVMVGAGRTNENYRNVQRVRGHISITHGADALYAGELVFNGRKLVSWNHVAGHFLPSVELRHTQLTPNVKRLLPEHLFVNPFEVMRRRRQQLLSDKWQ